MKNAVLRFLVTALLLLCSAAARVEAHSVRVSVLDRGQADGIVIRTPNHQWIVPTAGQTSNKRTS